MANKKGKNGGSRNFSGGSRTSGGNDRTRNDSRGAYNNRPPRDPNVMRQGEEQVEGRIDCKGNRFGFVINADGDIYVPSYALNGARHGDTVLIAAHAREGMLREGRVIRVIERNVNNIIATVVFDGGEFFAHPDDKHFGDMLPIIALSGASNNDKVIIDLKTGDTGDKCEVVSVIGKKGDIGVDVLSVIAAHNLPLEFDEEVLREAEKLPENPTQADMVGREDFRGETIFTIDGEDSKDFDDAVSLKRTEGGYELGVYIADVTHYVAAKSKIDLEAVNRATSVYLADRVIPMLPFALSNGICSLNEGVDRLTLAVIIQLDENGNYISSRVSEGVIKSVARLTYKGVQGLIDGTVTAHSELLPELRLMYELADKRIALKTKRGAIDFDFDESDIVFDEEGRVKDVVKHERYMSYRVIEEFMVLANEAIAKMYNKLKVPFVYRVHDKPPTEKLEMLNDYLEAVGIIKTLPTTDIEPEDVAAMLATVPEEKRSAVIRVTLRSMSKACYSVTDVGHFGLALKDYCHFTSPIRRYPDLMIHRVIKAVIHGGVKAANMYVNDVKEVAVHTSEREKVATECERKTDDYKKAEYMTHHIGEKYEGRISSVVEFGLFVELDNSIEGLIHVSSFPRPMVFDSRTFSLIGCGRKFSLGDKVSIIVDSVLDDRVNFTLSDPINESELAPVTDAERDAMRRNRRR